MIEGVRVKKLDTHHDERGFFREILRDDDRLLSRFGQVSVSLTKPGVIKAFHWHKSQDDVFCALSGRALVGLYDLRKGSRTHGQKMALLLDEKYPRVVVIPRQVAHGYKALGKKPLLMMYIMSRSYNRKKPDEQRISFDDSRVSFDWSGKGE